MRGREEGGTSVWCKAGRGLRLAAGPRLVCLPAHVELPVALVGRAAHGLSTLAKCARAVYNVEEVVAEVTVPVGPPSRHSGREALRLGRPGQPARGFVQGGARAAQGWTLVELMVVLGLVAVAVLIGALSTYRGRAAADQLACEDHVRAIRSALEVYYIKNDRTYPADQAAFDEFVQDREGAYFGGKEPRCPLDTGGMYHYLYSYDAASGEMTVTCPVPGSGHGSL